jgi:hypothetical protein
VRATLILCDFAEVSEGRLFILGGGWDIKGAGTPMGVGVLIRVPWTETNKKHSWRLWLAEADGQPVTTPTPLGPQAVEVPGEFEVGRPAGTPEGWEISVAVAVNVGPIPLQANAQFAWKLEIDGEPNEDWHLPFRTAPA